MADMKNILDALRGTASALMRGKLSCGGKKGLIHADPVKDNPNQIKESKLAEVATLPRRGGLPN